MPVTYCAWPLKKSVMSLRSQKPEKSGTGYDAQQRWRLKYKRNDGYEGYDADREGNAGSGGEDSDSSHSPTPEGEAATTVSKIFQRVSQVSTFGIELLDLLIVSESIPMNCARFRN